MTTLDPKTARILKARLMRVAKVLKNLKQAAPSIKLDGYQDGVSGEVISIEVPFNDDYEAYVKSIEDAFNEAVKAKDPNAETETAEYMDFEQNPLMEWLTAKKPANHPATKRFYEWVEEHSNRWSRIKNKDLKGSGFADTKYTWDYYKDPAAVLNDWYEPMIDSLDPDASDEDQATEVLDQLESASDVYDVFRNEFEAGDALVIRQA